MTSEGSRQQQLKVGTFFRVIHWVSTTIQWQEKGEKKAETT